MISNMVRIVTTAWCYYYITGEHGKEWAHDISGWLMMPLALVLVGLELQVLRWLDPERTRRRKTIAVDSRCSAMSGGEVRRKDTDRDELARTSGRGLRRPDSRGTWALARG